MSETPITSFQLPEGKTINVKLVKLADGRIVARTVDELAAAPPPVNSVSAATLPGDGEGRR
jgi:hypothetical protein